MAVMLTTTSPSNVALPDARRELGQLEDTVAAAGWMWDGLSSQQIDRLLLVLEGGRA